MKGWYAVVIGSVIGGLSRFALTGAVARAHESAFPYGTLAVNAVGCLIVGFLSTAGGVKFSMTEEVRLLLVTGFCGAFTTFSALILETVALTRNGAAPLAAAYLAASLVLGFAAFFAGSSFGRLL